ncbi:HU family DNA-binding protein [Ferrimonas aestuarii]|uniref:HU family DNA-binding protein n=1 Tax=Ferrimonas aestuarii TaxID=2569539 RepID=A0A4U1BM23_9GAMM|nr:HU family DNA-binding protein [Ferrimonas aestuarii]TKB54511.1 HU family DNA-binding protein [Ferrimonas aestuarii]
MNRQQLVHSMAERSGLTKKECQACLKAMEFSITKALHEGEKVYLPKLGVFEVRHHLAKTGRNPTTGETIEIPFRTLPAFRANDSFKAAIQN